MRIMNPIISLYLLSIWKKDSRRDIWEPRSPMFISELVFEIETNHALLKIWMTSGHKCMILTHIEIWNINELKKKTPLYFIHQRVCNFYYPLLPSIIKSYTTSPKTHACAFQMVSKGKPCCVWCYRQVWWYYRSRYSDS